MPFNGSSKEAQGQGQPTKAKKEKTPASKVGDKRTLSDTKSPAKVVKEPTKTKNVDDSSSITSLSDDGGEQAGATNAAAADDSSDLWGVCFLS